MCVCVWGGGGGGRGGEGGRGVISMSFDTHNSLQLAL